MIAEISQSSAVIVAGCGEMGMPMAERLLSSGYDIKGFDIRPTDQFDAARLTMCSPADLVSCDILISVVRDSAETNALCFDQQGVFCGNSYPRIFIVCSTLKPSYIAELRAALPEDVHLVDAPMSGASFAAVEGTLTFMLGGEKRVLDQLTPVFKSMGTQLFRAGDVGAGMTLKVLNNYVAATSVVSVRRVLDAANRVGVSHTLLREVMSKSSGETWFGKQFDQIEWSREGYALDNTIGILEKDVMCALDVLVDENPESDQCQSENRTTEEGFDRALLGALRNMREQKEL